MSAAPSQPQHCTPRRKEQAAAALELACRAITPRLSDNPTAWRAEGRRHVVLWDSVEWSVRDNGADFRCRPTHGYGEFFYPSADLGCPVSRHHWPLAFGAVLADACGEAGLNPGVLPGPTGDWLRSSLRRTFHGFVAWNDLRRELLRWLTLDPLTLAIHRRIFEYSLAGIETFNWVHRHLRHLSQVAIERPRMLPFLRWVKQDDGIPLEALERRLRQAGITPRALAWLEKVGFTAFDHAAEQALFQDWAVVVARYARLLERLRIDDPARVVSSVADAPRPDWFFLSLQREAERLVDEGVEEADAIPADCEEVMRWIHASRPEPDANQRRAGWAWLQAQARAHRVHAAIVEHEPWACPYAAFPHAGLAIVPITSVPELRAEGLALRNCLEGFAYDCVVGEMQPFSVRAAGTGERLACFMLVREGVPGRWAVMRVAGPMNREPPEAAITAADLACEQCDRVDAEARRARAMAARGRLAAAEGAAYEAANDLGRVKALQEIGSPPARG